MLCDSCLFVSLHFFIIHSLVSGFLFPTSLREIGVEVSASLYPNLNLGFYQSRNGLFLWIQKWQRIRDTSLHSPSINTLPELSTHKSQITNITFTFTREEDKVIKKNTAIQRRWLAGCRKGFHCAENFALCEYLPAQTL